MASALWELLLVLVLVLVPAPPSPLTLLLLLPPPPPPLSRSPPFSLSHTPTLLTSRELGFFFFLGLLESELLVPGRKRTRNEKNVKGYEKMGDDGYVDGDHINKKSVRVIQGVIVLLHLFNCIGF